MSYRNALLVYGIFHQIRVDFGREFYLVLGMQEHFQEPRTRKDIAPYRQTQSKKVMTVQSLVVCEFVLLTEI